MKRLWCYDPFSSWCWWSWLISFIHLKLMIYRVKLVNAAHLFEWPRSRWIVLSIFRFCFFISGPLRLADWMAYDKGFEKPYRSNALLPAVSSACISRAVRMMYSWDAIPLLYRNVLLWCFKQMLFCFAALTVYGQMAGKASAYKLSGFRLSGYSFLLSLFYPFSLHHF